MPYFETEPGIQVYYEDRGQGDKYIFTARMHMAHYCSYPVELSKMGYHVIDIQVRGFGKSTHVVSRPEDVWMEIWSEDVYRLAKQLGVERFAYTGISHGSGIGFQLMYNHPEAVIGYAGVVCGPHPRGFRGPDPKANSDNVALAENQELYAEKCRKTREAMVQGAPEYLSDYWKEQYVLNADERYEASMARGQSERTFASNGVALTKCRTDEEMNLWMQGIKVPCIFLGGMRDKVIAPEWMLRTHRNVPRSKLVMFEDAGHDLSRSHTAEVAVEIDTFFKARKVFE